MIMVLDAVAAEADLASGRIVCPHCGGRLRPWSYASERRIRLGDGSERAVRPRRGRCAVCLVSQVLLPGWCLPRRPEVVVGALLAHDRGLGYRRVAARVGRSVWTVRGWLRRARGGHFAWLRRRGVEYAVMLDRETLAVERAPTTPVGAALSALAMAVAAYRRRMGHADTWALIGVFTAGRLLAAP